MSSIKLTADSGGGTFEIKAPSSSGNTRVLTLPDTGNYVLGGKILQVDSVTLKDAVSATAAGSTTFADIPGFSITMTPAASTSKFLIICHLNFSCDTVGRNDFIQVHKDGSVVTAATGTAGASGKNGLAYCRLAATNEQRNHSMMHLDTAGGTSAITYKLVWSGETGTRYLNRRGDSTNGGAVSNFTVMEVAA